MRTGLRHLVVVATCLLAGLGGAKAGCCCPSLWTAYGDHCYRIFSEGYSWHQAEQYCQGFSTPSRGEGALKDSLSHLASIHSLEEQNFVYTFFNSGRRKSGMSHLWLGLHDRAAEGTFEWTDGTPFDYSSWRAGQPDNSGSREDCGHIRSDSPTQDWNDLPCTEATTVQYFICKLPIW